MERNLLERMVHERDEKITVLQKTISIQKDHLANLQSTLDKNKLRQKQNESKTKMQMDSIINEKDLALRQLRALEMEREKYRDTVFNFDSYGNNNDATALISPTNTVSSSSSSSSSSPTPVRVESAHALFLQSQLFQAMHSISALQIQTEAIKENCDAVIKSLQEDLNEATEEKNGIEVNMMSQLTLMEREKGVMEGLLEEKIRIRDEKLKEMERKIRRLEGAADSSTSDDSSSEDENENGSENNVESGLGFERSALATLTNHNKRTKTRLHQLQGGGHSRSQKKVEHEEVETLLEELEQELAGQKSLD